jgi:hypothetical protein
LEWQDLVLEHEDDLLHQYHAQLRLHDLHGRTLVIEDVLVLEYEVVSQYLIEIALQRILDDGEVDELLP